MDWRSYMRKPLALMLAGLMAVSMVGCGMEMPQAAATTKTKQIQER